MNAEFDCSNIILETDSYIIRKWEDSDFEDLMEFAPLTLDNKSEEELKNLHKSFVSDNHTFALQNRIDFKVMGYISLCDLSIDLDGYKNSPSGREINYAFSKKINNTNEAKDAIKRVVDYCFKVAGFNFLLLSVDASSKYSEDDVLKCGFNPFEEVNNSNKIYFIKENIELREIVREERHFDFVVKPLIVRLIMTLSSVCCVEFLLVVGVAIYYILGTLYLWYINLIVGILLIVVAVLEWRTRIRVIDEWVYIRKMFSEKRLHVNEITNSRVVENRGFTKKYLNYDYKKITIRYQGNKTVSVADNKYDNCDKLLDYLKFYNKNIFTD